MNGVRQTLGVLAIVLILVPSRASSETQPAWRDEVDGHLRTLQAIGRKANRDDAPAPDLFDRIEAGALKGRPADDPDVAFVRYAKAYAVLVGKPDRLDDVALPLMKEAAAVFDRRLPENHRDRIVGEMAWCEYAAIRGNYGESADRQKRILRIQQAPGGPGVAALVETMERIAYYLEINDEWAASAEWHGRAVKLLEEKGEVESPAAFDALANLARLKSATDRDCQGLIQCYRRMAAILEKNPGLRSSWRLEDVLHRLAVHLRHQNANAEARDACIRGLDAAVKGGDPSAMVPRLLQELESALKALGEAASFEALRVKYQTGGTTRKWN